MSLRLPLALIGLILMAACTMPQLPKADPERPYAPERAPRIGDVLHLPTGYYVDMPQMLAAATDTRIVYVGETHDNPASHRLELEVLRAMAERYPGQVALAMEMLVPAQQPVLDEWSAGTLDEKEFLRRSRWYDTWRMDFDYYRELLLFARDKRIPLIGINAEKSLVQQVGRNDIKELSAETQAVLPEMDYSDPYQQALVEAIFGGHEQGNKRLAGFQRVQTLWDETMAQNIARYLVSPQGTGRYLLVVAGGNHIRNGFGIPRRVFRRLPVSYTLIGTDELEVSEAKKAEAYMNVAIPAFPMPAYDFLVYTRYEELERGEAARLGVMLGDQDGKVRVQGVIPGSDGAQGGLRDGDQFLAVDGQPVRDSFDVIYAVKQKRSGDRMRIEVERDNSRLQVEIVFTAASKQPAAGAKAK